MSTDLYRTLRLAYGRTDDEPFREIPGESDGDGQTKGRTMSLMDDARAKRISDGDQSWAEAKAWFMELRIDGWMMLQEAVCRDYDDKATEVMSLLAQTAMDRLVEECGIEHLTKEEPPHV